MIEEISWYVTLNLIGFMLILTCIGIMIVCFKNMRRNASGRKRE